MPQSRHLRVLQYVNERLVAQLLGRYQHYHQYQGLERDSSRQLHALIHRQRDQLFDLDHASSTRVQHLGVHFRLAKMHGLARNQPRLLLERQEF